MIKTLLTIIILFAFSLNATASYENEVYHPSEVVECLAKNIYFEARGQDFVGQVAIAFVTLNRVESKYYPNDVCSVVTDGYVEGRQDCQFSWYCDGISDTIHNAKAWDISKTIAHTVLHDSDNIVDPTNGATNYHANYVNPWWSKYLTLTNVIEDHIFYHEGSTRERSNRNQQ